MKYGMNLLLWGGNVDESMFPLLGELKAAGFDGVEVPLFGGDEAQYKAVRKELDDLGLECTTVTVLDEATSAISADAGVRKASLERLKWAIDMNAVLNSRRMCGPFHSPLGVFSGAGPTDAEKKHGTDTLRQAAEYAATHNIHFAIEYLNRFECYFLTTAKQAAELVRAVDHPNFRCMYDTFHAHIEEKSQSSAIQTLSGLFTHVHISENDRGVPGTGQVHWNDAFEGLKSVGYDGWMVIEAFGRALPDLAAATRVWRDLFVMPKDVYVTGLQFMKEKWATT